MEMINEIIEKCNNLCGNEKLRVEDFGKNKDLTLYIQKDCDYNPEIDKDKWNIFSITTVQNYTYVDDTEDIYVNDGSLYKELERIYNYKDFELL